jgi:ribosome recycling factor
MVAKVELRPQDKESRQSSVTSVDKCGEEVRSLVVDRKRLNLKDDLTYAMKDGEDNEDDCNW